MSLDAQEYELRKIAEQEHIEIVEVIRESMSAKAPGRPLFSHMLQSFTENKADMLLCWKLDRLARNPVDGGSISWLLQQNQIKAIRTHERTYLSSDNVLLMSVEFGMSNQYVRDLSENVKRGNREKVRRGEWPNRAPYGYKNDKNTKTLKVVKSQADKIKELYELYVTGTYSFQNLANIYSVSKSQIELRLKRHAYYGMIEYKGELYPGNHTPIISKELFDRAQVVRNKVRVSPICPQKLSFPFRGLLSCHICGCSFTATRKKGQYDYYYCTNGKGVCSQHTKYLNNQAATDIISNALADLSFDEELIELMYEAARERHENGRYSSQQTIDTINYQIHHHEVKERKLLHSFTNGYISESLYQEEAAKLQEERTLLETRRKNYLNNAHTGLATLELTKELFLSLNRAVSEFENADSNKKETIAKNLLWNLRIEDGKVAQLSYKTPYNVIANTPKNSDFAVMLPD